MTHLKKYDKLGVPDEFWIGRQMMCWNYDKTPWEEFPDMTISLLSSTSSAKEFTLKMYVVLFIWWVGHQVHTLLPSIFDPFNFRPLKFSANFPPIQPLLFSASFYK